MQQTAEFETRSPSGSSEPSIANEARASGVSWPAVIAGALVAAALSLSLLALGGMAAVLWLIVAAWRGFRGSAVGLVGESPKPGQPAPDGFA
jgi:hypothetical protein